MKRCSGCRRLLPEAKFYLNSGSLSHRSRCQFCFSGYQLERFYTISRAGYNAMVAAQDGCCGLCRRPAWPLRVDHDHDCCAGQVTCGTCTRRLLCDNCNKGLGMLMDDPDLLRLAAYYVEDHRVIA